MGTTEYRPRGWVVRIPAAFVGYDSIANTGFQTVVIAQTPDDALDVASNSHVSVSYTHLTLPTIYSV